MHESAHSFSTLPLSEHLGKFSKQVKRLENVSLPADFHDQSGKRAAVAEQTMNTRSAKTKLTHTQSFHSRVRPSFLGKRWNLPCSG